MKSMSRTLVHRYAVASIRAFRANLEKENIGVLFEKVQMLKSHSSHQNNTIDVSLPTYFAPLYKLMDTHKRIALFVDVLAVLITLWCKEHNIQIIVVSSACELDMITKEKISQHVILRTILPIAYISYKISQKLIAGIRIETDNYVWEYSFKGQLEKVKRIVCEKGNYS